ncbi:ATP-grasp domain-containing protein [Nocardioides donggukensis]|uniref:ATP-grasp domain-containing protein n=1 Tax=Nocardioides donggukensis TaxID=2774019 RepID=A0A927K1D4_9ACTN|nr:hypothetical protein [Nocardioides donggukensis]MBD8868407.1 hypothetical protein [Nocardioides donggukensis]
MTDVLLATCADLPQGEPGAEHLDRALAARGIAGRWASWDDPAVDWAAAGLVAVRATWDYVGRPEAFLDWARGVERGGRLLNGAGVFAWNLDKAYLCDLPEVPVVPTVTADSRAELAEAVRRWGTAVVKPRVGAGGVGVLVVDDPADPRLGTVVRSHPDLPPAGGPWVVQPLVDAVRTEGETSVFVLDGVAVSQADKLPAGGEIRVHEHYGGSTRGVPLRDEAATLATGAVAAARALVPGDLDYARVDMMRLADGTLAVSELELIEPGLYLDVVPGNADPFADLVARALGVPVGG